jgi:1,4-alpha-glucan branching enzyme
MSRSGTGTAFKGSVTQRLKILTPQNRGGVFPLDSNMQPVLFRYPVRGPGPVALVGSFNNWDPRTHLLRRVDRDWRIIVYLPPGTYPYAFVTNGQLVRDPDPLRSSFSTRYSVLIIERV